MEAISDGLTRCVGCGGVFPVQAGPTHRYMESSPGCWAVYGEVLAREYADRAYYAVHHLSVDTYAAQHPGQPSPQSIQLIATRLISLCLIFEHALPLDQATAAMRRWAAVKVRYHWLEPPSHRGRLTALDVHRAASASEYERIVWSWARDAWWAWEPHHTTIRLWTGCVAAAAGIIPV